LGRHAISHVVLDAEPIELPAPVRMLLVGLAVEIGVEASRQNRAREQVVVDALCTLDGCEIIGMVADLSITHRIPLDEVERETDLARHAVSIRIPLIVLFDRIVGGDMRFEETKEDADELLKALRLDSTEPGGDIA